VAHGEATAMMAHGLASPAPAALEIGLVRPLHRLEERLTTRRDACRLLYVSDIHLRRGRSETLVRQILEAARRGAPDLVLLGGDLVDRASELGMLSVLVGKLRDVAPVFAVGGNHDDWLGMARVGEAVTRGGGNWIHDRTAQVTHRGRTIAIAGPDASHPGPGEVRVLCAHNPRVWKRSHGSGFDLVLAGHLHGCQLVAWEYRDRLFPGALFYPYCFLSHQRGATRLVVSRGVSDLLPIRWNCPREVVVCHV